MEKSMNERIETAISAKLAELEILDFLSLEDMRMLELVSKIYDHCESRKKNTRSTSVYTKQSNEDLEKDFA